MTTQNQWRERRRPNSRPTEDLTITTEKVLEALLRLGFDDYAILCARHVQLYREQQQAESNARYI